MPLLANSWVVWACGSAVFAALTALLAKASVQQLDADLATLIRTAVVLVVLSGLVAVTGKWQDPRTLPPTSLGLLALSGLATGASWLCYFRALKLGPAAKVAPVDKLSVVLVAVLAVAFLGERLSPRDWVGVGLVGLGVGLLAWR